MAGERTIRLGEVCQKIGSGATPRGGKEAYKSEGISLIRSQNVYNDRFTRNGLAFIDDQQAAALSNVEIFSGDVLLNITGDSVARCCQVPDDVLPARVNQHVAIIRPNPAALDDAFVRYVLVSPQMQAHLLVLASAGATRNALTKGMIESLEVPYPSLPEQQAIAGILGALDGKIELNRRMNETLESMARAIFKSWFVDFDPVRAKMDGQQPTDMNPETAALFPDSFEEQDGEMAPKGWEVCAVSEVVEVNPTRRLTKGQLALYLDMKSMPTHGHHPEGWIDREFNSGTRFINGDTLLARITPCLENGKTAFVDFLKDDEIGWGSTEYIVLRPRPPLPLEFGYYLARSDELRLHAITNMTGSSGRQRVPPACLDQFLIAVPSEEVAAAFGKIVKASMVRIKSNCDESRTLANLRDTLLPKLLSGELRVPEAEKQVEEVA